MRIAEIFLQYNCWFKYNKNSKNRKVAQFFKDREKNLDKMILENSTDGYVKSTLESVVENLKKEVNEALAQ